MEVDVRRRSPLKESDLNRSSSHTKSSSASLPSSMDTCTLSTDNMEESTTEDELEEPWARLFPVGASFESCVLTKNEYSFGRGEACDYQFNTPQIKNHPCYLAYSKVHFKIVKENTSTGVHVFLIDLSSNGTFINGEKVGKNCQQVLNNNDEIALCLRNNKAFIFMDATDPENKDIPKELKDRYTLSKILGRGACGEVRLAFEKGTCNKYAVKIIQKKRFSLGSQVNLDTADKVINEVNILKSLKHPCIIGIENVIDTRDTLFIVLELVEGGELFERVVREEHFDEPTAKLLFFLIVLGVKYLHDQGITHRDLKPENILLMDDSNETLIKVTDFGLSKFVDANTMLKTFCGTPNYLAPEVLLTHGTGYYTNAVDCWSLGVILFICLVGYPPFTEDRTDMNLVSQITEGHYSMPQKYWSGVSDNAKDVVKKLLVTDPEKRFTLEQVLNHPWFQDEDMRKKAEKLMCSDPMKPPQNIPKKRKSEVENSPLKKRK